MSAFASRFTVTVAFTIALWSLMSACMVPADASTVGERPDKLAARFDSVRPTMPAGESEHDVTVMEPDEDDAATPIGQWMVRSDVLPEVAALLTVAFDWSDSLAVGHGACGADKANFYYFKREANGGVIALCHEMVAFFAGLARYVVLADSVPVQSSGAAVVYADSVPDYVTVPRSSSDPSELAGQTVARAQRERFVAFVDAIADSGQSLVGNLTPAEHRMLRSTVMMALLHEVGHAMTDLMHLPVFGQQEPTADEIAQLLAIEYFGMERQMHYDFIRMLLAVDAVIGRENAAMQDAHGPAAWRAMRFACRLWASDPIAHADVIDTWHWVKPDDREGCREEWGNVLRWKEQLVSHLKHRTSSRTGPIAKRSDP